MKQIAPYGSWASPVTSDVLITNAVSLTQPELDSRDVYWLEQRPQEGGRTALLRMSELNNIEELVQAPWNVRTRVHEYGGGAYTVHKGTIYFVNFNDQRLYRLKPGKAPLPLTPESNGELRYADMTVDAQRGLLYCVREDHRGIGSTRQEAENTIVAIDLKGDEDEGRVIISGSDFYSNPRLSPDDGKLCWLSWEHPNMPWDGTALWVAELDEAGNTFKPRQVAGGIDESVFQPCWSPDGTLYYISDRTQWWNLYRVKDNREEAIYPMEAEFGLPAWIFGMATFGFESAKKIVCAYQDGDRFFLATLDTTTFKLTPIETGLTTLAFVRASPGQVAFLGGSPSEPWALYRFSGNLDNKEIIRASRKPDIELEYISIPEQVEFPTDDGQTAHGYFYCPANPAFQAPEGEKPPLIVMSHGGPTSSTSTVYRTNILYFTSRGLAVLDVNYGGSTGYGRIYRRRLNGNWGIVDMKDCVNGALYLVEKGLVDKDRMAITGGSAGGYTTLCALTFTDVFKAGASYYGVADLEALAQDTHKFESRYLDSMVGPYPEMKAVYQDRSPIYHTDQLSCALIILQGMQDPVVPPAQADMMYQALMDKGLPVAYLKFDGEQHGFRKAENIKRSIEAELYFYSRIFDFPLADTLEPVKIENLDPAE
jgi:dipeptidyl aminopeptidase/acylaminoacyl peptidase